MTEVEQQALALINEVLIERGKAAVESDCIDREQQDYDEILCRAIERNDAFRQEVSDAVAQYERELNGGAGNFTPLRRFIIAKPDPLVEALEDVLPMHDPHVGQLWAGNLRTALAARGLKIVEADDAA